MASSSGFRNGHDCDPQNAKRDSYATVILSEAKNLIQYNFAPAITSSGLRHSLRLRSGGLQTASPPPARLRNNREATETARRQPTLECGGLPPPLQSKVTSRSA